MNRHHLANIRTLLGICTLLLAFGRLEAGDGAKVVGTWKWSFGDQSGNTRSRELRIKEEGGKLVGVVVREEGRETPVKDLKLDGDKLTLKFTVERNGQSFDVEYEGKVAGDTITGTSRFGQRTRDWTARREPAAAAPPPSAPAAPAAPEGKGWVELLKGNSLAEAGWKLRPGRAEDDKHKNFWTLKDGILSNSPADGKGGIDIVTDKALRDFELHVEFNVPAKSNSGVYLRGVYEVQVEDTAGREPESHICGSIYGQKAVSVNAAKPAGEWQTFDITLRGNKVTVIHNGQKVIDDFELKGKTGGALGDEVVKHGEAGPLMLQGDHGNIQYRNIRIRSLVNVF